MIDGLAPYPKYKESGSRWLGAVPSSWRIDRLKNWVNLNPLALQENTDGNFEFSYLDIGSVKTGFLANRPTKIRFCSAPSRARRVLRCGDTIVSTVRTYLKAVFTYDGSFDPAVASTGFAVLRPTGQTAPRFVGYFAQSDRFTNQVMAESIGIAYPAISETNLGNVAVAMPPPSEQATIVRFLDYASGRLERAIRAKKRLIALLNEQKKAIIHRAVTRGLDPDSPLKSSGIPWLDKVPQNWKMTPNRSLFQIRKRIVGSRHREFQVLSLTKRGVIVRDMEAGGKFSSYWERLQEVRPGNMVFCFFDVDETPRGVGLARVSGMISPDYTIVECPADPMASFLELFYIAMDDHKLLKPLYTGLRKRISKPLFLASKTPIPPRGELETVIKYVKGETAGIDKSIAVTQKEIALMQEYRTRLVADVVTGKLDVREAAQQLPQGLEKSELTPEPEDLPETEAGDAEA